MNIPLKYKTLIAILLVLAGVFCFFWDWRTQEEIYVDYFGEKPNSETLLLAAKCERHRGPFGTSEGHAAYFHLKISPTRMRTWIDSRSWTTGTELPANDTEFIESQAPVWFHLAKPKFSEVYYMKDEGLGFFKKENEILYFDVLIQ